MGNNCNTVGNINVSSFGPAIKHLRLSRGAQNVRASGSSLAQRRRLWPVQVSVKQCVELRANVRPHPSSQRAQNVRDTKLNKEFLGIYFLLAQGDARLSTQQRIYLRASQETHPSSSAPFPATNAVTSILPVSPADFRHPVLPLLPVSQAYFRHSHYYGAGPHAEVCNNR